MPEEFDAVDIRCELQTRTAVILGVTADIGRELAKRLLNDGWQVFGIGRTKERLGELNETSRCHFIPCDLTDRESILSATNALGQTGAEWDLFISCAGTMEPIGPFFSLDFDKWESSIVTNMTAQLRVLHASWSFKRHGRIVDVMFLAGGGTNNPFRNYSAYCVSKIALIKMCELIDDEERDVNAFIIGPGFVPTRIHEETFRAGAAAGDGLGRTRTFLMSAGTSFDDIYTHMCWCMSAGRHVAGGRNFSTVHDLWRDGGKGLLDSLPGDANAYRLRRHQPG